MDQLGLSIQDARIHTSAGSLCFNSYIVLDESGHSISADKARCRHIERTLTAQLSDLNQYPELAKRRIPRRLKQFARPTQAELTNDAELPWSVLRVVASDRPGLLARLGIIFVDLGINVHNAKISTLGERVEDLFYITGTATACRSATRSVCKTSRARSASDSTSTSTKRRSPAEFRMNPVLLVADFAELPYPFERMNALKSGLRVRSNAPHIALSIGEPKHATAPFLIAAATDAKAVSAGLATYPATRGSDGLRAAISAWTTSRFRLRAGTLTAERHVLPVSGTREALFSFGQCVLSGRAGACAVLPNPFYQIYEGAILLRGTTPYYVDSPAGTGYLPDFDSVPSAVWRRVRVVVHLLAGQPDRRGDAARTVDATDRAGRSTRLRHRGRRVLFGDLSGRDQRHPVGLLQACAADRPRRLCALRRLSQPVEALQPAGLALRLRRRRRGDSRTLFPVSDLPRLRDAGARSARQPARVVGRNPCRRQPRGYREKFATVTPMLRAVLGVTAPEGGFYYWPTHPDRRRTVHAAALCRGERRPCCPADTCRVRTAAPTRVSNRIRMAMVAELDRVHRCRGAYRALRAFAVTAMTAALVVGYAP